MIYTVKQGIHLLYKGNSFEEASEKIYWTAQYAEIYRKKIVRLVITATESELESL